MKESNLKIYCDKVLAKKYNNPFISLLKGLLLVVHTDKSRITTNSKLINGFYKEALPFLKEVKINPKPIENLLNSASKSKARINVALEGAKDTINDILKKVSNDRTIDEKYVSLLRAIRTYFNTSSDSSFNTINKLASIVNDPEISKLFVKDIESTEEHDKKVRNVVKKLTGENRPRLTAEEAKKYFNSKKKEEKSLYEIYKQHNSDRKKVFSAALQAIIRESHQKYLPISKVKSELLKRKVTDIYLPEGFIGEIGENGELYTKFGESINGGVPSGKIEMNPNYKRGSSEWVFKVLPIGQISTQMFYSSDAIGKARKERFEKVQDNIKNIDKYRSKWLKDLKTAKGEKQILALMCELIHETGARIGNTGSQNYGLSTLQVRHITQLGNKVRLMYAGKKGMRQLHVIEPTDPDSKLAVKLLLSLTKNKDPKDFLFSLPRQLANGDTKYTRITSADVNSYLTGTGFKGGPHKLRHVKGTKIAKKLIEQHPLKLPKRLDLNKKQKLAEEHFKSKIAMRVGGLLGHKKTTKEGKQENVHSTAIRNYIDPSVMKDFFDSHQLRIPVWLKPLLKDKE